MRPWLLMLVLAMTARAAPNRVEVHPKLPFAVLDMASAPDGFLYLAGSTGLHRYDGFRYTAVPGYPYAEARQVGVTKMGVVWAAAREGIVRLSPSGKFEPVLSGEWVQFAIADPYVFVTDWGRSRLLRLDATGTPHEVATPAGCGELSWQFASGIWLICPQRSSYFRLDVKTLQVKPMNGPIPLRGPVLDSSGHLWIVDRAGVVRRDGGPPQANVDYRGAQPLVPGRNGQVWLADGTTVRGLSPELRFPFSTSTSGLLMEEDYRGHVWVARRNAEDLWELIQDPKWEQWHASELGGTPPVQVLRNGAGELIAVGASQLFRLDENERRWSAFPATPHGYEFVLALPEGGYLASVRDLGLIRLSPDGAVTQRTPHAEIPFIREQFRKLVRTPDGHVLLGNRYAFYELLEGHKLQFIDLPAVQNAESPPPRHVALPHVLDFEFDPRGALWAGYDAGLVWRDAKGAWQRLSTDLPLNFVRSFQFRGPDEIWVAHRYEGSFSVVRNSKVTRFSVENGYLPERTYFLKTDRRGWIWRGTNRGVYVSNGQEIAAADWLFLDAGGESRPYGFFEDRDGSVWITGRGGITHVRPEESWFTALSGLPQLSRVFIDGQEAQKLPEALERIPEQIEIEFARIMAPPLQQQPIRYRLLPQFSDWRVAQMGRLELRDIVPGTYQLEVRHKGSSSILRQTMRFGPRIFPGWLWLGPIAAIAAGWILWRREYFAYQLRKAWYLTRRRWAGNKIGSAPSDLTGRLLRHRYTLQKCIAHGGFSDLYSALDSTTGEQVAVKILHQRLSEAVWVRVRFAQELAALQLVRHRAVVRILDSWIEPTGEPCLVMPLLRGQPLRAALTGAPWEAEQAARLLHTLGEAVAAVHAAGVVHRDIKPENILVCEDGEPVLLDFGASGLLGSAEESGRTMLLAGSLEYLAPERLTGHYSPASDLYSLAAVAFELLSGVKLAHSRLIMSAQELPAAIAGWFAAEWKWRVATMLAAALNPVPEQRPTNILAWSHALSEALCTTHPPTSGASPSSPTQTPSPPPRAMPAASGEPPLP